jgi:GGDEF domain-containing protein
MISIHEAGGPANRPPSLSSQALECYVAAVANLAHYAVELDDDITTPHRKYLTALAAEVQSGDSAALAESRGTLRGLLRDYRDRAARYLGDLRHQMEETAKALQETIEALSHPEDDPLARIRAMVARLRESAASADGAAWHILRTLVTQAADEIDQSVTSIRQQNQLAVSQLQTEIRLLHARVESLENAAAVDEATKFSSRRSIEEYIQSLHDSQFCVLILKLHRLEQARAKFGLGVVDELVATFARRLRNSVPREAVIGRWNEQDFLAVVPRDRCEGVVQSQSLANHLSMPYACLLGGKTVRISLSVTVQPLPCAASASSDNLTQRLCAAFEARN